MRFSIKKIVLFLVLVLVGTITLYLANESQRNTAAKQVADLPKKPIFREERSLGNYEGPPLKPRSGPGENGEAHHLRPDQKDQEERLKNVYGFNQLISDEISLDRNVPDLRESECKHWDYPENLPKASVIFIFHNEGWTTLLRSIHSVINRTPSRLLHEVVLVDDFSELTHLHKELDQELMKPYYQNKVKLVRNKQREGLIRARNIGGVAASGEVLVFLDAHCEVGHNWLPPLLAPIHENPRTLAAPVIDGINWNDFGINPVYSEGSHSRGIFEWGMLYKETELPEKEAAKRKYHSEPYNAPTHAGGLFAIKRSWFKELGWYDPGLQIWGGENYELSFKLWQCGGRQQWVPCSRIGHVYRGHSCSSCHSGGMDRKWGGVPLSLRNYKRLVEVWFDPKYKEYFYTSQPLAKFIDMGDVSEQLALKKRMNCKSFDWFMKEVAYDVFYKFPAPPPNTNWGEIRNLATGLCIDTMNMHPPDRIGTSGCHSLGGNQLWRLNKEGRLTSGEWCVQHQPSNGGKENELSMEWCKAGGTSGSWEFLEKEGFFMHKDKQLCLVINNVTLKLNLARCDKNNKFHKWAFKEVTPQWALKKS